MGDVLVGILVGRLFKHKGANSQINICFRLCVWVKRRILHRRNGLMVVPLRSYYLSGSPSHNG